MSSEQPINEYYGNDYDCLMIALLLGINEHFAGKPDELYKFMRRVISIHGDLTVGLDYAAEVDNRIAGTIHDLMKSRGADKKPLRLKIRDFLRL